MAEDLYRNQRSLAVGLTSGGVPVTLLVASDGTLQATVGGATLTNLEKAEDAAHTSGDKGILALVVRENTAGQSLTNANGDYAPIVVNTENNVRTIGNALSSVNRISANTNNAEAITASATGLFSLEAHNFNLTLFRYLKIYDKATAPDPSSDTPKMVIALPPLGAPVIRGWAPSFVNLQNGLAILMVTGLADTDNTAVAANEIVANFQYRGNP